MKLDELKVKNGVIDRDEFERYADEQGLAPSECVSLEASLPIAPVEYDLDCDFSKTPKGDLNSFKVYKAEVEKIPLLSAEEERELSEKIQANRPAEGEEPNFEFVEARNTLVEHNLALGIWYAKKYIGRVSGSFGFEDLIQECNKGLMVAAENYDASVGGRFSTYAYYALRTFVAKGVAKYGYMMRVPARYPARFTKLQNAQKIAEEEIGYYREPTVEEIVAVYNRMYGTSYEKLSVSLATEILKLCFNAESIDVISGADRDDGVTASTMSRGDMLQDDRNSPEENCELGDFKEVAEKLLFTGLTEQERRAFLLRYGTKYDKQESFNYVAEKMGISKQRATTLCHNAEEKLAKALEQRGYAEYSLGR